MANLDHPNDEGRWTRLELSNSAALWKRERQSFRPVTQFYVIAPPHQHEILYDEVSARRAFKAAADQAAGRSRGRINTGFEDPELQP